MLRLLKRAGLILALGLLLPMPANPSRPAAEWLPSRFQRTYVGSWYWENPIRVTFTRQGSKLSGKLRAVGEDYLLVGTVDASHSFSLKWTDLKGREIGEFSGGFSSPVTAEGGFSQPQGSSHGFYLEEERDGKRVGLRGFNGTFEDPASIRTGNQFRLSIGSIGQKVHGGLSFSAGATDEAVGVSGSVSPGVSSVQHRCPRSGKVGHASLRRSGNRLTWSVTQSAGSKCALPTRATLHLLSLD